MRRRGAFYPQKNREFSIRQTILGASCAIVLACAQPALAGDFHPLTSQDLTGGVYEFDHILIPEGVTLTLVGEPRQATLRALGDLTLAGTLVAPGWEVTLQAGGNLQLLGSIDVGGGGLTALGAGEGVVLPGGAVSFNQSIGVTNLLLGSRPLEPGHLQIVSEHVVLRNDGGIEIADIGILDAGEIRAVPGLLVVEPGLPVPEPETWALLLAGLGLVGWRHRRRGIGTN